MTICQHAMQSVCMARRRSRTERLDARQAEMRARQERRNNPDPAPGTVAAMPTAAFVLQRHYKFSELEEITGVSHTTLRAWFANEKELIRWAVRNRCASAGISVRGSRSLPWYVCSVDTFPPTPYPLGHHKETTQEVARSSKPRQITACVDTAICSVMFLGMGYGACCETGHTRHVQIPCRDCRHLASTSIV